MDKYDEVTLQIRDILRRDLEDRGLEDRKNHHFDEYVQKKVSDVLKSNFSIKDEELGRGLIKDVWLFDPETGYEFYTPLFVMPMLISLGVIATSPETFPNYSVENKYIGYTDKGRFYRINDFSRFMRRMRKNPILMIMLFVFIYLIITILVISVK